jgi:hypothetical protein
MSLRAATMSNPYSPNTRRPGFFRKLAINWLFVVGIAGFMSLLNLYQKNLSLFWMTVFAVMSIGLAAGSTSRITFYQWPGYVRFFVMLFAVPLGLFSLGVFTVWQMGIGPLNPWTQGILPQDQLFQLGGAFLIAVICLEAWWKPRPKIEDPSDAESSSRRSEQSPPVVSIQEVRPRPLQISSQDTSAYAAPRGSFRLKFMKAAKTRSRTIPVVNKLFLTHTSQPVRSKRKRNRKPQLQISVFEEHRCPYCLDDVKRNDPRGVKECEVCHSLHHADCWAITGMCQVPHLNT